VVNDQLLQANIENLKNAILIVAFSSKGGKTDWWLTLDDPKKIANLVVKFRDIPSNKYEGVVTLPGILLSSVMDKCVNKDLANIKIATPMLENILGIEKN